MGTWNAYGNEYWPADYLIDATGKVRYAAFGEGDYDKTETAIRALLAEKGSQVGGHGHPSGVVVPSQRGDPGDLRRHGPRRRLAARAESRVCTTTAGPSRPTRRSTSSSSAAAGRSPNSRPRPSRTPASTSSSRRATSTSC